MKKLLIIAAVLAISNLPAAGNFSGGKPDASKDARFKTTMTQDSRGNQKLTDDIRSTLTTELGAKGFEKVTVTVKNGEVTLAGTVQSAIDKDKVEKQIRGMDGVRNLRSQIIVIDADKAFKTNKGR